MVAVGGPCRGRLRVSAGESPSHEDGQRGRPREEADGRRRHGVAWGHMRGGAMAGVEEVGEVRWRWLRCGSGG